MDANVGLSIGVVDMCLRSHDFRDRNGVSFVVFFPVVMRFCLCVGRASVRMSVVLSRNLVQLNHCCRKTLSD